MIHMVHLIRRGAPLVAALLVLVVGLVGASCTVSVTGPQTTPSATSTATFAITFNGKIFQCSTGHCPPDVTWDGSSSINSSPHAAVLGTAVNSQDPNYTDKVTFDQARACFTQPNQVTGGASTIGCFAQNPGTAKPITISTGSVFLVHTSGVPSATTPPALGVGYYSVVQVYSDSTDANGAPSLLLYFVTYSADGNQRAAGAAAVRVPLQSAHVTVNMQTSGGVSVLDGSTGTSSATATATSKP